MSPFAPSEGDIAHGPSAQPSEASPTPVAGSRRPRFPDPNLDLDLDLDLDPDPDPDRDPDRDRDPDPDPDRDPDRDRDLDRDLDRDPAPTPTPVVATFPVPTSRGASVVAMQTVRMPRDASWHRGRSRRCSS
jgi:hypothetical protein